MTYNESVLVPVELLSSLAYRFERGASVAQEVSKLRAIIPKPRVKTISEKDLYAAIHGLVYQWKGCDYQDENRDRDELAKAIFDRLDTLGL